jgi:hypothetical protein
MLNFKYFVVLIGIFSLFCEGEALALRRAPNTSPDMQSTTVARRSLQHIQNHRTPEIAKKVAPVTPPKRVGLTRTQTPVATRQRTRSSALVQKPSVTSRRQFEPNKNVRPIPSRNILRTRTTPTAVQIQTRARRNPVGIAKRVTVPNTRQMSARPRYQARLPLSQQNQPRNYRGVAPRQNGASFTSTTLSNVRLMPRRVAAAPSLQPQSPATISRRYSFKFGDLPQAFKDDVREYQREKNKPIPTDTHIFEENDANLTELLKIFIERYGLENPGFKCVIN